MSAKNHYLESVTLRRDAVADWSAFPFCVPALRHFEGLDLHPKVTFFVGENGTGKSTLLEALAEKLGFRASGGSRVGSLVAPAYESALAPLLRIARTHNRPSDGFFLRAESFTTGRRSWTSWRRRRSEAECSRATAARACTRSRTENRFSICSRNG